MLIDLSACGRVPSDLCPPVGPGLTTRDRVRELAARGVFEIPHPAAHVLATCLGSLGIAAGFVAVTVMLGASAGGRDMITKTVDQTTDLLRAQLDLEEETQRAFNAFMRDHERALASAIAAQTKALLAATPQLVVQASGIPVLHGTALAIALPASPHSAGSSQDPFERLRSAPGVLLIEQGEPLAIADAVGQEAIMVTAERESGGLTVWAAFDNTRLAALNALWVAETLIHTSPAAN